ncbi:small VCP/p97-interacting protein isoform X1 [Tyto alba]|uniref:small VCP/p97-interacting protein isoform X1 n=1 Tax=Tyto alba TaxID=56313 RepID=UPI001C67884C|nr:small VCP/p97-interacting protein isoform X1 [Tyto alba]
MLAALRGERRPLRGHLRVGRWRRWDSAGGTSAPRGFANKQLSTGSRNTLADTAAAAPPLPRRRGKPGIGAAPWPAPPAQLRAAAASSLWMPRYQVYRSELDAEQPAVAFALAGWLSFSLIDGAGWGGEQKARPAMPAPGRRSRPHDGAGPARARRLARAAGGAGAAATSPPVACPAVAGPAGGGARHGAVPALHGGGRQGRGGDARPGNKKTTASRSC